MESGFHQNSKESYAKKLDKIEKEYNKNLLRHYRLGGMVHSTKLYGELKMTKDDIKGFALIPLAILGCIFHEELANLIGVLLN